MGARAYRLLALYEPAPGALVEVGSERDEGSTAYLAPYAKTHGLRFYTADIDPEVYEVARRITDGARLCSGRELLKRLRTISIAYLDGFDWIPRGHESERWITNQARRYRTLGYELTNDTCQREHLEEAHLVAQKAAKRCVVICDDTFQTSEGWSGKGGLAVPYLEIAGFRVVHCEPPEEASLGAVVMRRG